MGIVISWLALRMFSNRKKILGEHFDIHTGGVDHIPIHHENEIAQSKGATGQIPANYWMHSEFLLIDGGKMSKSLGNIYTLKTLEDNGIEPLAFKLFCFSAHYRNKLNFTFDGVKAQVKALERLRDGYKKHLEGNEEVEEEKIKEYENRFHEAINDDLNMPLAMGVVWEVIREEKNLKICRINRKIWWSIRIRFKNYQNYQKEIEIPENIKELIEKRNQARKEKIGKNLIKLEMKYKNWDII